MTVEEIQYRAQAIIQKWKDDDSAPYVEFVEELATMPIPEPQGLDEAAEKYSNIPYNFGEFVEIEYEFGEPVETVVDDKVFVKDAFKAGAEWMAGQGESRECTIGMATEEIHCHLSEEALERIGVSPGDKVVVQIRKEK